jgi:hypothetical protein
MELEEMEADMYLNWICSPDRRKSYRGTPTACQGIRTKSRDVARKKGVE